MTKGCYVGIGGTAHKVKKGYVGIGSKARKVKKAYVGIGGVARVAWSGGELAYYGTVTPMSRGFYWMPATTIGAYALIADEKSVEVYSEQLVHSVLNGLGAKRSMCGAAHVGNYALFAGGTDAYNSTSEVTSFDKALTRNTQTGLSVGRHFPVGVSFNKFSLFAGGDIYSGGDVTGRSNAVDAYSETLVRSTPTALSVARSFLGGTTVGKYAIFAGGSSRDIFANVDAYNQTLVRTTPLGLSVARTDLVGAHSENHAIFAGGSFSNVLNTVDAYDSNLVLTTPTALSEAKRSLAATSLDRYAIFGGGSGINSRKSSFVDAYDGDLVKTIPQQLSIGRECLCATTVKEFAMFCGGKVSNSSTTENTDVYTII